MKKSLIVTPLLLSAMVIITSCGGDTELIPEPEFVTNISGDNPEQANSDNQKKHEHVIYMLPETRSITLTSEQKQMVECGNKFAYSLFQATSSDEKQKGKSLLMSPLSLMYDLGMLNDGAAGDTEAEISSLFGVPADSKAAINGFCQALLKQAPLTDPSVTLRTANIVATAYDIQTAQQYRDDMLQYYAAETASLDFTQPEALLFLNDWCNEKTQGMIPKILDTLDPATRMVLMNAVYFKATWTSKFDGADTRNETFIGEDGQTSIVPMMHRKAFALYAPGDSYSVLCLPYGSGTQWQMMVLLPNEGTTVDDIVSSLTTTPWEKQWQNYRGSYKVDIKMPRFSAASDIELNDILARMGTPLMFSSAADFSPMTANGEHLHVSLLKQKAAMEVNEEGTTASSVTAAAMSMSANLVAMEADFHANRPFVYIIRETSSGAVFFIGTYRG